MNEIQYTLSKKGEWRSSKFLTPKFTVSYPFIFKPREKQNGTHKFEMQMLFDKAEDLSLIRTVISVLAEKKWGSKAKSVLATRNPIKDGDARYEADPESCAMYKNKWILNCSTNYNPERPFDVPKVFSNVKTVDNTRKEIKSSEEFYAGCIAIASVNLFTYSTPTNQGVSVGLSNILKIEDGTPLVIRPKPEADFTGIETYEEEIDLSVVTF